MTSMDKKAVQDTQNGITVLQSRIRGGIRLVAQSSPGSISASMDLHWKLPSLASKRKGMLTGSFHPSLAPQFSRVPYR